VKQGRLRVELREWERVISGFINHAAPDGSFGVIYTGEDPECCFIESFGQTTGTPAVSGAYIEQRHLSELTLEKELRFVDLVQRQDSHG
jgi:RES domain